MCKRVVEFWRKPALVLGLLGMLLPFSSPARAQCCQCLPLVEERVVDEFTAHRIFLISIFWEDNLLPALLLMADQLTAVAMQQVQIIGSFFDAKHQMETQQVFQKLRAQAHKDYHPSVGMCQFGSGIKSLAATERRAELNAHVMSQRLQDRALGNANTAASEGNASDKSSRLKQFREKYCDVQDNNNGLRFLCDHDQDGNPDTAPTGAEDLRRVNKDIDYSRTVDFPWTLNVDFTDTDLTEDEEDILALAVNLYSPDVFLRPGAGDFDPEPESITNMQRVYMDARSIVAKRSVAENSFNAITSMKSAGTGGSRAFLVALLEELGIDVDDVDKLLGIDENGDPINPSYYAQMEVLTKKIYQNPDFYTNLYDKPANVTRKGVALQAIGLMQKFDLFKSYLRNEASLSVLLELEVMDLQEEIEDEFGKQTSEGQAPD